MLSEVEIMPREQLIAHGSASLSDQQLLAILLRTGLKGCNVFELSEKILGFYPAFSGLQYANLQELQSFNGIGTVKAVELAAAIELGRRMQKAKTLRYGVVTSSQRVGDHMVEQLKAEPQEKLIGIFLDTKHQVIKQQIIFKGTLNSSVAHPREIFAHALRYASACFILVHNHPSGITTPSKQDIKFTKRIIACGELLGIDCLDHLIIGHDAYYSLKEEGII